TYLGGSGGEGPDAMAVDAAGNTYVTGWTFSPDFPATVGHYTKGLSELLIYDGFVAKFRADGTFAWGTYLGGSNNDYSRAIAVDPSGNVYVAGSTGSADFPTTRGAYKTKLNVGGAGTNAFVTKLDGTSGNIIYSTYLGASGPAYAVGDKAWAIAVDSSGNA